MSALIYQSVGTSIFFFFFSFLFSPEEAIIIKQLDNIPTADKSGVTQTVVFLNCLCHTNATTHATRSNNTYKWIAALLWLDFFLSRSRNEPLYYDKVVKQSDK